MKNLILSAAAILFLCLGVTGCSGGEPEMPRVRMAMGVPDGEVTYKPVESSGNLKLRMVSRTEVFAGEKTSLVFSIANRGRKEVSIPEWYGFEPDNLIVYVQPWLSRMTEPDPESWTELSFDMKKPVLHYPIVLLPGNQVMIEKELPFIEKLQVSPGKERRYFIKAETNLKSLKLATDVMVLKVRPKRSVQLR